MCPLGCGHAAVAVHQQSHTSCQSHTEVSNSEGFQEHPTAPFTHHSWEMTQLKGQAKCSSAIAVGAGSFSSWCSSASAGLHIAQCALSLHFLRITLEIFAFCETLTELKLCQCCCPLLLLLNKQAVAAFPPEPASCSTPGPVWGIYCTRTLTVHTLDLHHHLNTSQWTQTPKESFTLPSKKHNTVIHLSSPGQMHLTNNCNQWIININKAFNWNPVEKHFPRHSWQEPLNKCCFFAKYNIGRVITSQQRLRTYVNIMAEAWGFQSKHFIGWSNLGILPKFCRNFPPLALSFLRRCWLFLSTHTTC